MQYSVICDDTGKPTAFLRDDVNEIPVEAISITEDQWRLWVAHPDCRLVDGKLVDHTDRVRAENLERQERASILSELRDIDFASIRAVREWVAAQPGAPKFVLDHEAQAQEARARLASPPPT